MWTCCNWQHIHFCQINGAGSTPVVHTTALVSRDWSIGIGHNVRENEQGPWGNSRPFLCACAAPSTNLLIVNVARREVREETGLANFVLGPHIWNRRHVFTSYGREQEVREVWFFARVPTFDIDTFRFTEVEQEIVQEHRWWTESEPETTTDLLTPRDLATLLWNLVINGLPKNPMTVPI